MKTIKFILTAAVAALLPAFANASTNPIASYDERMLGYFAAFAEVETTPRVYFEREMNHEPITTAASAPTTITQQDYANGSLGLGKDAIAASFERDMLGNAVVEMPGGRQPDPVMASFERDMNHQPVTTATAPSTRITPLDFIRSSLNLGKDAIVVSFERDMRGNAAIASPAIQKQDAVLASFERDMYREPFAVVMAPATAESQELILSLMNSGKGSTVASFDLDQLRNLVCKLK